MSTLVVEPAVRAGGLTENAVRRDALIRLNRLWGIASRVATTLLGFLSVHLAIRYFGAERYGVWLALSTIPGWLALLELGLGPLLRNRIAQASAGEDAAQIRRLASASFRSLARAALAAGAIALLVIPRLPWSRWVGAEGVPPAALVAAAGWLTAAGIASLPLLVAGHVAVGLQRGYLMELCQLASVAAVAAGLWLLNAAAPNGSWLAGVLVLGVVPQLMLLLFFAAFFAAPAFRALRPSWQRSGAEALAGTAGARALFFGLHGASLMVALGESWVILHVANAGVVAQAGVVQRWYLPVAMLHSILLTPLHPAYAEAMSRGDHAWSRRTLARFSVLSWVLIGAFGVLLLLTQPLYVRLIGQGAVASDAWLGVLYGLRMIENAVGGSYATFLLATGRVGRLLAYNLLGAISYVPLALWLGRGGGAAGVVLAGLLAYLPVAVSNWRQATRMLRPAAGQPSTEPVG
ncbi:MAG: hypothetical protein HY599_06485 [Candidatus Omnitrophica bacterium]|nr:hypothetical protein [Candidatus Omnitrophota bacterium]